VTQFPELQQALVDAGRRRYGRAPRTWRVLRPVLVAAACAAVAGLVVLLAGTHAPDERVPSPAATPAPDALERAYAVFSRPATEADTLPDAAGFLRYMVSRDDRADFDPSQARLVLHDGRLKVYLVPVPLMGRPAVCAFEAYDGEWFPGGGCAVLDHGPVSPSFHGDPDIDAVHNYSFVPQGDRPGAIFLVARNDIHEVTVNFADGSTLQLPVRDNVAYFTPLKRYPLSIAWDGADGQRHTQPTASFPSGTGLPNDFYVPPERIRPPDPPEDLTP
jgi:hypothetical protein